MPSVGLTGSQNNQISLKFQNNARANPWITHYKIIKPLVYNQQQMIALNFKKNAYINLNSNSSAPNSCENFNWVLLQINGENYTNIVIAYINDFLYEIY